MCDLKGRDRAVCNLLRLARDALARDQAVLARVPAPEENNGRDGVGSRVIQVDGGGGGGRGGGREGNLAKAGAAAAASALAGHDEGGGGGGGASFSSLGDGQQGGRPIDVAADDGVREDDQSRKCWRTISFSFASKHQVGSHPIR